jgi:hypothetical protein
MSFDEVERFGTVHYRQAVGAAQEVRSVLSARTTSFYSRRSCRVDRCMIGWVNANPPAHSKRS